MGFKRLCSGLTSSVKWTWAKLLRRNFSMGHVYGVKSTQSVPGSRARNYRALLNFPLTWEIWPYLSFPWLHLPDAPQLRKRLLGLSMILTILVLALWVGMWSVGLLGASWSDHSQELIRQIWTQRRIWAFSNLSLLLNMIFVNNKIGQCN